MRARRAPKSGIDRSDSLMLAACIHAWYGPLWAAAALMLMTGLLHKGQWG